MKTRKLRTDIHDVIKDFIHNYWGHILCNEGMTIAEYLIQHIESYQKDNPQDGKNGFYHFLLEGNYYTSENATDEEVKMIQDFLFKNIV